MKSRRERATTPGRAMTDSSNAGDACDRRRYRFPFGQSWHLGRRCLRIVALILTQATWLALASGAFVLGCSANYEMAKLAAVGDARVLRERNSRGATDVERPSLLIIGIDGMKRDVL